MKKTEISEISVRLKLIQETLLSFEESFGNTKPVAPENFENLKTWAFMNTGKDQEILNKKHKE